MNKNLKELATTAGISLQYLTNTKQITILEEFAESIVKACYEHCKGQLLNSTLANEHNLSYNDGVADCAIGLLKHFGVEP